MTNSASEPGSDDILASIRRLVSAAPERPEPQGDRLLLTPALRVSETDKEDVHPFLAPRGLSLEDRIAELEAAVGSQTSEFEPDGSEVAHVAPPDDLVRAVENLEFGDEDDAAAANEAADEAAASPDETTADAPEVSVSQEPDPVEESRAERRGLFLAVTTETETQDHAGRPPEPSGGGAEGLPAGLFFTRHDRPAAEHVAEHVPAAELEPEPMIETQPEVGPEADAAVAAPIASDEQPTGDDSPATDSSEIPGDDVLKVLPTFRHAALRDDHIASQSVGGSSAPAVEIDEETLRAIVAELLREELQGPLGEKITRNIRKLVRREIERALAVRDFD